MTDLRYAIRLLRKSPLFTATIVLTLVIGIGATTAMFSVVHAILLRPLPFADPGRLMQVAEKNDKLRLPAFGVSALNYLSWKAETRTFAELSAIQFATFTLSGRGDPETYTGSAIAPSLLPLLGLQPVLGRTLAPGEDKPGAPPVALISEALWQRRFGGDPATVGGTATLNGIAYTIVGIAPPALGVLTNGDIWTPLVIDPPKEMRLNHVLFVVGRLAPGVTMAEARAEMDAIAVRVGQQYPEVKDWGINLVTFTDAFVSSQLRTALLVLLVAVVFVLVIVSANVAALLLARASDRQREMAVRAALGAGRRRLLRQLLMESLVLSAAGGAIAIPAAAVAVNVLETMLPPNLLPVPGIGLDPTVVAFAIAVTLATGIVFGMAPAWHSARVDVNTTLKAGGRSASGGARPWLRKGLAAAELALATILLVGAALLVRSVLELQRVPLGFEPAGVIAFQVALPQTKYNAAKRIAFHRELGEALNALPGIGRAGISSGIPFGVGNYTTSPVSAPPPSALAADASVPVDWRVVSPGFFATLGIPVLRGRDFAAGDTATAPAVMIVSRSTARTFWGDEDPIGRIVRRVADKKDFTVVGVVGDVRSTTLSRESPALYYSSGAMTWPLMDIVVRPAGDPAAVMAAVRQAVRAIDPDLPLSNVRPMREWVATSAAQPRLNAVLLGTFAIVALLVAAIGTYGVLAYSVSQRTKELGLRMALGADRGGVVALVIREGMSVGAAGIVLGVIASIAMSRALAALVFGVSIRDPWTYAGVATVLGLVALAACTVPALRAARVNPMEALRLD
jgi:putative ABC transport system permease protein